MKTHLNLIPPSIQRRQTVARIIKGWSTVVSITATVCLLACAFEWSRGVAAVRRLEALDSTFAPVSKLLQEQQKLSKLVADLRAREQLTIQLSNETRGVTLLGAVAEAADELGGSVYLLELDFERSKSTKRGAGESHKLLLEGAGLDSLAVAAFASRLRDSGVFTQVTVDSTKPIQDGAFDKRYFSFEIACLL